MTWFLFVISLLAAESSAGRPDRADGEGVPFTLARFVAEGRARDMWKALDLLEHVCPEREKVDAVLKAKYEKVLEIVGSNILMGNESAFEDQVISTVLPFVTDFSLEMPQDAREAFLPWVESPQLKDIITELLRGDSATECLEQRLEKVAHKIYENHAFEYDLPLLQPDSSWGRDVIFRLVQLVPILRWNAMYRVYKKILCDADGAWLVPGPYWGIWVPVAQSLAAVGKDIEQGLRLLMSSHKVRECLTVYEVQIDPLLRAFLTYTHEDAERRARKLLTPGARGLFLGGKRDYWVKPIETLLRHNADEVDRYLEALEKASWLEGAWTEDDTQAHVRAGLLKHDAKDMAAYVEAMKRAQGFLCREQIWRGAAYQLTLEEIHKLIDLFQKSRLDFFLKELPYLPLDQWSSLEHHKMLSLPHVQEWARAFSIPQRRILLPLIWAHVPEQIPEMQKIMHHLLSGDYAFIGTAAELKELAQKPLHIVKAWYDHLKAQQPLRKFFKMLGEDGTRVAFPLLVRHLEGEVKSVLDELATKGLGVLIDSKRLPSTVIAFIRECATVAEKKQQVWIGFADFLERLETLDLERTEGQEIYNRGYLGRLAKEWIEEVRLVRRPKRERVRSPVERSDVMLYYVQSDSPDHISDFEIALRQESLVSRIWNTADGALFFQTDDSLLGYVRDTAKASFEKSEDAIVHRLEAKTSDVYGTFSLRADDLDWVIMG